MEFSWFAVFLIALLIWAGALLLVVNWVDDRHSETSSLKERCRDLEDELEELQEEYGNAEDRVWDAVNQYQESTVEEYEAALHVGKAFDGN